MVAKRSKVKTLKYNVVFVDRLTNKRVTKTVVGADIHMEDLGIEDQSMFSIIDQYNQTVFLCPAHLIISVEKAKPARKRKSQDGVVQDLPVKLVGGSNG